jgi:uncharacterized membrane protein YeaQ/YmgE (transglycosylase-associated protein family)
MIWHILLGGLAGFLAGKIMRGRGYGILVDILLGLAGSWVGDMVFMHFHVYYMGYFLTSLVGAIILVVIGRIISSL